MIVKIWELDKSVLLFATDIKLVIEQVDEYLFEIFEEFLFVVLGYEDPFSRKQSLLTKCFSKVFKVNFLPLEQLF